MFIPVLKYFLLVIGFLSQAWGYGCFEQASDVVFALDSSWSIRTPDFHRQLSFLRAVIDRFTIGKNHMQVGVVSFGSDVQVNFKLNEHCDKRSLKQAVGEIKHLQEGTATYLAINYVHSKMFEPENGGRPWAKHQLVLITDGLSLNTSRTLLEASMARSNGIEIFSIGVGESTEEVEIWGVASEPKHEHVFRVENYKALLGIEKTLSSAACHESGEEDGEDTENNEPKDAIKECESIAADVVFIMDSSTSIWKPDFESQIKFIKQVISTFDISQDATRVGVVAYSDAPITLLDLTDKQTREHVDTVLSNAPYITGGTNTAFALKHARQYVLADGVARKYVPRVIIILTDGESYDVNETIAEAAQAQAEGIVMFAIGIGEKAQARQLMAMASDPNDKFVFHVDNFERLSEIKELLAIKTCDVTGSASTQVPLPAHCPAHPTDVVLIYDPSALSRQHHSHVIRTIYGITESKGLNTDNLRVGVMREASENSEGLHDIALTSQWTKSDFKDLLDPDSKTADIDILLRKARHQYFQPTIIHDNLAHKRTVLLFLDSALANPIGAVIEGNRLKRNANVRIVVITLGKHYNYEDALSLASEPHNENIIHSKTGEDRYIRDNVSKLLSVLCQ